VALVQCLDPNIGATGDWHPILSEKIDLKGQFNQLIASAGPLPIATFIWPNPKNPGGILQDPNNSQNWHYGEANGHIHAAFFLGYGNENGQAGFFVLDQYNLPPSGSPPLPPLHHDGTLPNGQYYEPAEIRFIGFTDPAAKEYYVIAPS
jgi:hypothetical protein